MAKNDKARQARLAVRYIDEDLVISDTHAQTWLKLPTMPYEFQDTDSREALVTRINIALSALVAQGTNTVDCHLIVTSRPVPIDYWSQELDKKAATWGPTSGWDGYLKAMGEHLTDRGFTRKEVYLGVVLGPRKGKGSPVMNNVDAFAFWRKSAEKVEKFYGFEDHTIPAKELDVWRVKARAVQRTLSAGHLKATPAHPNAVAWLIKKQLWPDMPSPTPTYSAKRSWGGGELDALVEGDVKNKHKWVEITQADDEGVEQTGFSATLCLARFPAVLNFPEQEPWIHFAASLAFPVDFSSRFTLVPATQVKKDVGKVVKEANDQYEHISGAGTSVPLETQAQLEQSTVLQYTIMQERMPWAYARHRLTVTAPTEQVLRERVQRTIEHYRDLAIDVVWVSGDQLDLLCEAMPGDKVRTQAYYQRQELSMLSGGMFGASSEVGDRITMEHGTPLGWVGPYIGETTSRISSIVHFSPHVAIAQNMPPGVAITGSPGGGKSYFAFTLARQMALQGVWVIYIDPKADAIPLGNMPGMGDPRVFDLRDGHDGMLDLFSLGGNAAEAKLRAIEFIELLIGESKFTTPREQAVHLALAAMEGDPQPSLLKMVDFMAASDSVEAKNLATTLRLYSELPFSRLCFAPNTGERLQPENGLTVVTLLGLDMPSVDVAPPSYTPSNRLAVAVMYLLTQYTRQLMLSMDKNHPKAICIDEAWVLTSTPQGAKLIPEVARMGRSHNTALVLVTQNAADLSSQSVTNSMSSRFAFRSRNSAEMSDIATFFDMSEDYSQTIADLENGECLFKDPYDRIARVQIDGEWDPAARRAFETNPEKRILSHDNPVQS